ncbi:MAG: helix-turn-helix transcriptional regulator [Rhodocyclaceae bacterium]|nr:helix-turn-helix transcriptional regulator [Rhodocyclaceae bacterium]
MMAKPPKTPRTAEQIRDSVRLRELFKERAGMSQLKFAETYEIGVQGMLWQYLNADKAEGSVLNLAAAIKFAKGLRCSVGDFSPTLQREIDSIAAFASGSLRTASVASAATLRDRYNQVSPERQAVIDFLLQDPGETPPNWIDLNALAYIDSLDTKARGQGVSPKSPPAKAKTGT